MRHITAHDAPATGLRGIGDTHWQVRGTCHGMDVEDAEAVFFPGPRDHEDIAEAKELCGWCPVRRDCLDFALENGLKEGIWGGLTKAERAPLHKNLHKRRDYRRVVAFFQGRDVHLNEAERQIVIDHAYVRGWLPERLAVALRISRTHARDLLRQSATKVLDRDRSYGMPKPKKKRKKRRKKIAPVTAVPVPRSKPGARPAAPLGSASAPLGKAA